MTESPQLQPDAEPPPGVTQRTLWRLATCVLRDHTPTDGSYAVCERCAEPWPCWCRRLAVRALSEVASGSSGGRRRRGNQAYLDWLATKLRRGDGG